LPLKSKSSRRGRFWRPREPRLIDVGVARAQYEHAASRTSWQGPSRFRVAPAAAHHSSTTDSSWHTFGVARETARHRGGRTPVWLRRTPRLAWPKTAYYPLVNYSSVLAGLRVEASPPCFRGPARCGSLGPSSVVTLFDVGRRRAYKRSALKPPTILRSPYYRETVLSGFQTGRR